MPSEVSRYLDEVKQLFETGHAIEQAYRPALQRLMESIEDTAPVNDPKHSEHGAPDFVFLKKSNTDIIKGYAEAKDVDKNLDRVEKSEQMERYAGYQNLFLTDYLEFRFYKNGEKYETISLGELKDSKLYLTPENGQRLMNELTAFMELKPESIKSGKRLAKIMGAKARRIRDNVAIYLEDESIDASELEKIYQMMKELLVHDLNPAKFADMYAQTLVYGLFVARYSDNSLSTFSRSEARDLVPQSNPFLLHFFDHIAGTAFDKRLAKIVDELCDIFVVSDVQKIVHKHLRIADTTEDAKDPIIHFYEDFLQAYDPNERKKMGAYYTPIPVVKFIVRHIDKLLKDEFGISKGLASTETITRTVDTQPWRKKGERKDRLTREVTMPRVQVLDPAVGTATFLNETIKFIHEGFKGQEGRWPSYVEDNLTKRLYGFELMMAPYTIAHLKLGMTLKETGVDKLHERLNVFLTNTLEEGVPQQPDLFSFGLAEAVSEESRLAAEVKSEKPVMVVMGNPPYSVSSNNKSEWIQELIADYKKDLNERKTNLDDDYIKFIRFAEEMIARNGTGIVGMITNNSYLDGVTHRQMRKHLMQTFDKIFVLNLHGNSKKQEVAPGGGKDENVFDIMQGVSIVLMMKNGDKPKELGAVYCADLWGARNDKFSQLNGQTVEFVQTFPDEPNYIFSQENYELRDEYKQLLSLASLLPIKNSGIKTDRDKLFIDFDVNNLHRRMATLFSGDIRNSSFVEKYRVKNSSSYKLVDIIERTSFDALCIQKTQYRPFDYQWIYYDPSVISRPAEKVMRHIVEKDNFLLITTRGNRGLSSGYNFITDSLVDIHGLDSAADSLSVMPLYLYHEDGTRTPNFDTAELSALTRNLTVDCAPEDILDYIYAVLHSPNYREKYKEFLKTDFPRVPIIESDAEFARLVPLGKRLRELHLMKANDIDDYDTTFPEAGDGIVDKLKYEDGKAYINATQYFGNVPELAWNFYIGGYQPAQKWLKDRRDRTLDYKDIEHYQRIIKILIETDKTMKAIDV